MNFSLPLAPLIWFWHFNLFGWQEGQQCPCLGHLFHSPTLISSPSTCSVICHQGQGEGLFLVTSFFNVPLQGFPSALPGSTIQAYGLWWLMLFFFILFQVLGQK